MDKEIAEIKGLIYQYYPRNLSAGSDSYTNSVEYRRLKEACEKARNENEKWLNLKNDIAVNLLEQTEIYDYSVLGITPTYHATFTLSENDAVFCVLLISVIAPKWTFWILDRKEQANRFHTKNKEEELFIDQLGKLVDKYFQGYGYLTPNIHQLDLDDVENSFGKEKPRIYDLLFDDIET